MTHKKKCALALTLIVLCAASAAKAAGASAAQVQQIVSNSDRSWLSSFVNSVFNNMLYALTAWLEMMLYLCWVVITWAVVRLYSGIGTYLIPIWDFSNGLGFFHNGENAAYAVVSAPQAAAVLLQSMVPWILSLCGLLMFGLAALAIPKSLREGREPFEAVGGLALAAGFMVAFPLLYSVPIHIGNFLGREFYQASHEKYLTDSGVGAEGAPPSLFSVLVNGSVFPNSSANLVPSAAALAARGYPPTSPYNGSMMIGLSNTSQLESAFQELSGQLSQGGDASLAWATAKEAVMYDLEMQASRFIQVILGFMALIALVGLLMLKGGQIVALVLNYYLGWIACALYVHPSTRPIFGLWLKNHIRLCLWGLLWAFLIFIMDIVVVASQGLPGMVQQAGAAPGVFMGVGMFLMPFILFASMHKFKQVGELTDSLTATGKIATQAGTSVHQAFAAGMEEIPVELALKAGGMSAHGRAGESVVQASEAFAEGMNKVAAAASKAVATIPAVGPAAAFITEAGLKTIGTWGQRAGTAAGKSVRGVNRFYGEPKEEEDFMSQFEPKPGPYQVTDLRPEQERQS